MTVRAVGRAKVNLYLSVEGLRPDGYHELAMVMQALELCDELTLTAAPRTDVVFRWPAGLRGADPERPDLVERAVEAHRARSRGPGARVEVRKRIPLASGMAGGSADAAAALVGMEALTGGALGPALPSLALELGSDVPFALTGGTCLASGRGERLERVPCPSPLWWVVGMAGFGIATPAVFRRYDTLSPGRPGGLAELLGALAAGDPGAIAPLLHNDLARAARALEPRLAGLEDAMRSAGALGVVVSGSGPTVAGLCRDAAHAAEVGGRAAAGFDRVEVVASASAGAELRPPQTA
jgi:4-diphosphocytidyl-2-C-methyl-D-erythritol kinase